MLVTLLQRSPIERQVGGESVRWQRQAFFEVKALEVKLPASQDPKSLWDKTKQIRGTQRGKD